MDRGKFSSLSGLKSLILVCFLFFSCSPEWIRKLPPNSVLETDPEKIPGGMYVRNRPERSHRNTLFYKNTVQEKIFLNPENRSFEKSMRREVKDVNEYTTHIVSGKGKYSVAGNWVLLETNQKGETLFQGNGEAFQIEYRPFHHKLLYHYDSSTKTLVPLLYESGYKEKTYGLLDGVNEPYSEDRYFQIARKNFLKKEFQFHAYFYKP
ncbi:putative lipoprotein [Leptospira alstonii serovar Pingchang str. 80-412]|uniref:Lipoprotein n=2 Tax=Leptospira alstonii TaxID=28452 RepID=T0H7Y5_9LEPT|nr:putative lipoprotein [Leptospira alstonii serovar Sichuan str. 79601]EQA79908.1 putative lipoprotein [Leptospira alstonii serovar Pingchang str. 80-412]